MQGPIAKYRDFAAADGTAQVSAERTCRGIRRFALGLFKKLFIADILAIAADRIFADSGLYNLFLPAWLGAVSYLLQLYFDFSGYTDMALGLAAMLGYELPENFRYPYAACGMRDFWRRWHISLSAWFTDYVYIPLGGNRRSRAVTCRNIMIVFFLTGIWHGSAATFIAWGLLNGIFVMLEHIGVIRAFRVLSSTEIRLFMDSFLHKLLLLYLFRKECAGNLFPIVCVQTLLTQEQIPFRYFIVRTFL